MPVAAGHDKRGNRPRDDSTGIAAAWQARGLVASQGGTG